MKLSRATIALYMTLVFASGAGAAARFAIGLVIATGISIGTLFTLFVVPAVYVMMAGDHSAQAHEAEDAAPALQT